ncbi:hypothetical protein KCN56_05085 [Photobacterium galatheae]|nr:hypothetical protein [Photobacterium galatheae]
MGELQTPIATATQGLFTATLTWNGSGDVDLHTFEPDNQQVYYNSKIGNSGNLDVDNTSADGPEHYYVDCEDTKFQLGTYRFGVNNFSRAEGREAVIQISNATTANIITQKKVLGPAEGTSGNSNPEIMVSVTLRKDGDKYSVSVN